MKLSDYLDKNDLSKRDFAMEIGVTPKAVEHWVKGLRTPSYAQMCRIINKTLGEVTPNDFFQGALEPRPGRKRRRKDGCL